MSPLLTPHSIKTDGRGEGAQCAGNWLAHTFAVHEIENNGNVASISSDVKTSLNVCCSLFLNLVGNDFLLVVLTASGLQLSFLKTF
jgi:hypothetical protein